MLRKSGAINEKGNKVLDNISNSHCIYDPMIHVLLTMDEKVECRKER